MGIVTGYLSLMSIGLIVIVNSERNECMVGDDGVSRGISMTKGRRKVRV